MRLLFERRRHILTALHDALMAGASFWLALYLRLGDEVGLQMGPLWPSYMGICALICLLVFSRMRLYRGLWRYASLPDLLIIVQSVTIALLLFYLLLFSFNRLAGMPRSVPFIQWLLLSAMLGGPRFLYRMLRDHRQGLLTHVSASERIPVLLIGAGERAELFLRDTRSGPSAQYAVIGIVDDNPARIDSTIHNVRIWGHLDNLAEVVERLARKGLRPQRAILTYDALDGAKVRRLLDTAEKLGLPLSRLPRLSEFKNGMQERLEIRPIAVEDLLGRAQNVHDKAPMHAFIAGKVVLVTGAGGTIGAELSRQIASLKPAHLLLYEVSEYALYQIDQELSRHFPQVPRTPILGDVRDGEHLSALFAREKPQVVFHAAAIKHVPLAELNPEEAALTNIIGTQTLADACTKYGALVMVLISTDKAVNPASVMGATKRAAESYCQALAQKQAGTRYVMVRFGNVLGSTGSVVPLFQEQLARGGPLTVTHADMVRYFMTVREAVELVLQAATLSTRNGELYVLDMGQPVRILDLAEQMIRLAGLKPHSDVKIEFTGLRKGEKLVEELFHFTEEHVKTAHESIWLARQQPISVEALTADFAALAKACVRRDSAEVLRLIKHIVPEFHAA